MSRTNPDTLRYYDQVVTEMMCEKYGFTRMDAIRRFVGSETHKMLEDTDYGLLSFGAPGIFDIWESEAVTGDPRNSVYIRED